MGYNVAKAVIRLSRFMRSKFYQDFKDSTYNSNNLNLEYFEKWLAKRFTEMLNPIAAIIQTCENTKKILQTKIRTFQMSGNNGNTDTQQFNFKCWFCNKNDHKVSLCPKIKDLLYPDKIKTIKVKTVSILYQIPT